MEVEFVEFYPFPENKNKIHGTLHIYIIDYKMDIRGIYVRYKDKRFWFRLPTKVSIDPDSNEQVTYPVISFDVQTTKELMSILKQKGRKFVMERIKSPEFKYPIPKVKE